MEKLIDRIYINISPQKIETFVLTANLLYRSKFLKCHTLSFLSRGTIEDAIKCWFQEEVSEFLIRIVKNPKLNYLNKKDILEFTIAISKKIAKNIYDCNYIDVIEQSDSKIKLRISCA